MSEPKIFLAVLAGNMQVCSRLYVTTCHWMRMPETRVSTIFCVEAYSPVTAARNLAVEMFLQTDCTHILFVDNDIVPPMDAPQKLLAAKKPVVSGLCWIIKYQDRQGLILSASSRRNGEESWVWHMGVGVEEVDTVPGGCFLVEKEVFEAIGDNPFHFIMNERGTLDFTEEIAFGKKVQEAGYKLYTDFDVECDHVRAVRLASLAGPRRAVQAPPSDLEGADGS